MDRAVLADLGDGVRVERAVAADIPAIVGLLADDFLGADRETDPQDHAYRGAGVRLVQLLSSEQRVGARRFYERLGFVADHVGMGLDLTAGG